MNKRFLRDIVMSIAADVRYKPCKLFIIELYT